MGIKKQSRAVLVSFITLIAIIFTHCAYARCDKEINQKIQAIIDKDRETLQIPGIELSIICPEDTSPRDFVSGTTKMDGDITIQTDNLFQVGSETKSFVATIILQLEAEGFLTIDDKIEKWLPSAPSSWKGITIRQLLNHTSGIYNYTDVLDEMLYNNQLDYHKEWSPQGLVDLAINRPIYFEPGMGWHYSNTNYLLAGMIIEAVTSQSFDEEINTRLIKPLKLTDTYYIPTVYNDEIMQRIAHGYSKSGLFPHEPLDITDFNSSWAGTAGANISTSHDMAIWFKNLTSGNILPPKQMSELMSLVDENNGQPISDTKEASGYGLAIMHDFTTFGEETWWHTGGTLGYSAIMVWLKCSDVIVTADGNDISADVPTKRDLYFLTKDVVTAIQKSVGLNQCSFKS